MPSEFAIYLRAARDAADPGVRGLSNGRRRRVPGLRREEVAAACEVSVDYYTRLEQGREHHPSAGVVDAIARGLGLVDDAREHLFRLAQQPVPVPVSSSVERVDPQLLQLMDGWPTNPAVILNRTYDVLAFNRLGQELFRGVRVGDNLVERFFCSDEVRALYRDWADVSWALVGGLRWARGYEPSASRVDELVARLEVRSKEFAQLWQTSANNARGKSSERKRFVHPSVGDLTLTSHTFDVRGGGTQQLTIYQADPGGTSAEALRLMGIAAASADDSLSEVEQVSPAH